MLFAWWNVSLSCTHNFQDNRLTGDRRAQAAEACHAHLGPSRVHASLQGFFGCDEFGHLYISDTAAAKMA